MSGERAQVTGGCLGHGFAWLLASMLIIAVMLVIVLGCYWMSRLVR